MDTSLQRTNLTAEEANTSLAAHHEEPAEGEHHIHLPNPSLWPLLLSGAILITVIGIIFFPENPWLTVVGAPLVLIGILGWAFEDPMAGVGEIQADLSARYANMKPEEILDTARGIVESTVTISSTAYSTHPVRVEIDDIKGEGIVLALYGKVELEAQRDAVEVALWGLPKVINVLNFIVAEDSILNAANARLDDLRAKGKLEGSNNVSVLVENYILHLYGDVPNNNMKFMLERELIGISGVRVVVNHIGLNEDIPGNLGRTRNKI
ncbi:MAG: hypothetical protein NVSMB38_36180 [Ktedonobacteraceae bacterium]